MIDICRLRQMIRSAFKGHEKEPGMGGEKRNSSLSHFKQGIADSDATTTQDNNKRIAKNTLFLYARMLIVMVVSLFTVRVVLNTLGAEDYGIKNVVGGVVTMFAFLTSTMVSASLRFFAYTLGKKDYKRLSEYFSMSFWCYLALIVVIVALGETVGLWFVKTQLTIPAERMDAALWVYQCSVVSFAFSILSIPYNSIVIAREQMNIYAYMGLLEVFLKLGAAYGITAIPFDALKVYAVLMCVVMSIIYLFYVAYGTMKFPECSIKKYWDKATFREVINYSAWSLFGAISGVIRSQGINILLNIFFNPVVNAARAIAYQINSAINQFVLNFHKAVQPQITKYHAAQEKEEFFTLIFRSTRFYFYLILFLSLPVLLETPFILTLWLKNIPENTILFTRLVIIIAIIDSLGYPLQTAISATGKIKQFQIVTGGLLILNLPIAWIYLSMGYPPESTMYVAMALSLTAQMTRVYFSHIHCNLPIQAYISKAILPIVLVIAFSIPVPLFIEKAMSYGISKFFVVSFLSMTITFAIIMFIGITKAERKMMLNIIHKRLPWKR